MNAELLAKINWVDLLSLILFLRIIYVAARNGFISEFFKFCGILTAVFFSFHYHVILAQQLNDRIPGNVLSVEFLQFFSFCVIASSAYISFSFLRRFLTQLVKMETVPALSRWGGLILGIFRGILTVSLILFILACSGVKYLNHSIANSFSGKQVAMVSQLAYDNIWQGFASKFMSGEKSKATLPKEK
jgi:uncharacterized membrane protein required for colicin V production